MLICSDLPLLSEGKTQVFDLENVQGFEDIPAMGDFPAVRKKGSLEVRETMDVNAAVHAAIAGERVIVDEKFRSDFEEEFDRILAQKDNEGEEVKGIDKWLMKIVDKGLDKIAGRKLTAEEYLEGKVTFLTIDRTQGPVHVEDIIVRYQDAFKMEVEHHASKMKNAMNRIVSSTPREPKYAEGLTMAEKKEQKIQEDQLRKVQKIQEAKELRAEKIQKMKETVSGALKGFGGKIKGIFRK